MSQNAVAQFTEKVEKAHALKNSAGKGYGYALGLNFYKFLKREIFLKGIFVLHQKKAVFAERLIKTIKNFREKPIFEKRTENSMAETNTATK